MNDGHFLSVARKKKTYQQIQTQNGDLKDFSESDFFPGSCELCPSAAINLILSPLAFLIILFQYRLVSY